MGISEIKEALIQYLKRDGRLHEVVLTKEFPAGIRANPVKKSVVAVGFSGVEVVPGGFGGYLGEKVDEGGLYGKIAVITVYFDIHCPPNLSGNACHELYEIICDALALDENSFGVSKMWCEGITGDKTAHSNRLRAFAALRGAITKIDSQLPIRDFLVQQEK